MIEYYKKFDNEKLQKVSEYERGVWVKVVNPSEDEIDYLVKRFDLEKDLLIDGLDIYEIPRIDEENHKAYFFFNIPTSRVEYEFSSSFLLIVSKELLITVSKANLEIFDRIEKTKNFYTNKITRSLLQIVLFSSNSYSRKIRSILKDVRKDRKRIRSLTKKDITDLVLQEDTLNDYLSSFTPLIDMHSQMLKLRAIRFAEDEKEFIEDLIIDLKQTHTSCKTTLKTITNMRDYYSTALSHNLNRVLSVLTIFTVILTIPTVISGIYGMNVEIPFQGEKQMFWILTGITLLFWVIILAIFKKSKVI